MTDGNAELEKVESRQALPDEPSPLPEDPERYVEAESVLVIKRSTLYYVLFSVILFFGAYIIGWIMGSASGSNAEVIRAAVHEAIATEVSRQSGYPGSIAAAQPAPPTEDPNQRFVVSIAGKPALGPENAPVTMVEFSDFQCPYCGRFFTETEAALLKKYDGKIRFVYRHFPLDSIHPFAQGAALASECANEQNKFWEYHDLLFQNQQQLGNEGLLAYAKRLNLDIKTFQACVDSAKYASKVQDDVQAGDQLGVNGTPTFFINGRKLVGAQPLSAFTTYIDAELAAASSAANSSPTILPSAKP